MPVSKFSISLFSDAVAEIEKREGDRSSIVNTSLERYFAILSRARRRLADLLSDQEMGLILDVLNGTLFSDTISLQLVYGEIEDSLPDGYAEKWEVDGPALVEKLRTLTYPENVALVDAVERWWSRVAAGEQPGHGEALKK